jgi:cation diffusion facilitator CzcD-associated flavoprotein CzcO
MTGVIEESASNDASGAPARETYDVVIIGAGTTGLYQLYLLREQGVPVTVLEAGAGVGGTWFWNRYPGCRLDSEVYSYQYAFSDELLQEWDWSELFAGQPELEKYYNFVADKFDLRPNIQFDTTVEALVFDESTNSWIIHTDSGVLVNARFVIAATGILSAPNFPNVPGLETFAGEWHHTARWPDREIEFAGKRVAVIGTGATGIQVISEVAKSAAQLTVFQRSANWTVPLRNRPLSPADRAELRSDYPRLFEIMRKSFNGFVHDWDPRTSTEVSEAKRNEQFEKVWSAPGFAKWFGLYHDIATDPEANENYCDFVASKIRQRIDDPAVADKLIPQDHLFGTKRVPCETDYFEVYNQDNVELVELADNPIIEFIPTGLRTAQGDIDAERIIIATGFDAFTGALNRIDIRGVDGLTLRDKWKDGPKTYLGVQVAGFPNLFIVGGPHGKGGHGNSPRCSEPVIQWLAELIQYSRANQVDRIEADPEAELKWTEHVNEEAGKSLRSGVRSYVFGDNVEGKTHAYVAYAGSLTGYVEMLQRSTDSHYQDFQLLGRDGERPLVSADTGLRLVEL